MAKPSFIRAASLAAMLAVVGLTAGSMTACTSTRTSESSGEYVDDAIISNKVRAAIIADKDVSIFTIDVETYKGVVQLSGFVDSSKSKSNAGSIAAGVPGVKHVRNDLVIK